MIIGIELLSNAIHLLHPSYYASQWILIDHVEENCVGKPRGLQGSETPSAPASRNPKPMISKYPDLSTKHIIRAYPRFPDKPALELTTRPIRTYRRPGTRTDCAILGLPGERNKTRIIIVMMMKMICNKNKKTVKDPT